MSTNPPRNVIYFSNAANSIPLAGIATLPYTDVIVGFLIPDSNVINLVGDGPAFADLSKLRSDIKTLQGAGINVLISVGGEVNNDDPNWTGWTSAKYQKCAGNVDGLVEQIVYFVQNIGASGVDLDYEDSAAFMEDGNGFVGGYNGIAFLSELTNKLYYALPPGQNIITHAPQVPYWDVNYNSAPYWQINGQVGQFIQWYNNQFYNNGDYDGDAAAKVAWYKKSVAGIATQKMLMGVTIEPATDGFIGIDDMTQNVIVPLQGLFAEAFGGVMTWEFAFDTGGAWAKGIAQALGLLQITAIKSVLVPATHPPHSQPTDDLRHYTIQSGDTLVKIAERFYGDGSQWTKIRDANHGIDPNNLKIGQQLQIPSGIGNTSQHYTIQSGDTLVKIAEKFYGDGSQWTKIRDANHGIDPNNLKIGQRLQIPPHLP
jgi:chitinase